MGKNYWGEYPNLDEVLQNLHNYINDISNLKDKSELFIRKYKNWNYRYTEEIDDNLENELARFIKDKETNNRLEKYLAILNSISSDDIMIAISDVDVKITWGWESKPKIVSREDLRSVILEGKKATEKLIEGIIERRKKFNFSSESNLHTTISDVSESLTETKEEDVIENIFGFFKDKMLSPKEYKRFIVSLTLFIDNEIIPDNNFKKFTILIKKEEVRYAFYVLCCYKQQINRKKVCLYMKRSFTNFEKIKTEETLYKKLTKPPASFGFYIPDIISDMKQAQEDKRKDKK